ncbi:hypothetical protein PtA15_12A235 [Puccinia triticina]|uniref:Uncharacterized protein n=1 Tax=Puccinia triticina TaxID=208348 RepID=A0ABY7D0M6_9BASI|nr:uncharacterized protein PtA15_12A235 [Puccinia triticina]WAQ90247.1 hypothetical protein PtA15_12A235 [Puccinia triticina]WAR61555.1 hypothetical protein PtB15_12B245 [Puccinia triticina]
MAVVAQAVSLSSSSSTASTPLGSTSNMPLGLKTPDGISSVVSSSSSFPVISKADMMTILADIAFHHIEIYEAICTALIINGRAECFQTVDRVVLAISAMFISFKLLNRELKLHSPDRLKSMICALSILSGDGSNLPMASRPN